MGRDFKIGLMSGVVLGFIALIWVATRPSQSPQARLREPSTANAQEDGTDGLVPDPTEERPSPRPTGTESTLGGTASPDLTTARPEPNGELFLPEQSSVARRPAPRPSETPNAPREENREEITTTRFHIVQSGETLSGIAQQYYGSASQWRTILEANQETIKNADRISPGTKLIIPW